MNKKSRRLRVNDRVSVKLPEQADNSIQPENLPVDVLYEDDLDSEGNQQMVYPLDTRFLLADGTQLVDEADYTTRLGNGEEVFIACFAGCTYHCG